MEIHYSFIGFDKGEVVSMTKKLLCPLSSEIEFRNGPLKHGGIRTTATHDVPNITKQL